MKKELRFGFVIVLPEVRGKGYGKEMLRAMNFRLSAVLGA